MIPVRGWKALFSAKETNDDKPEDRADDQQLPSLVEGDYANVSGVSGKELQTKPPVDGIFCCVF